MAKGGAWDNDKCAACGGDRAEPWPLQGTPLQDTEGQALYR